MSGTTPKEVTVVLKGESSTYRHKFLVYEDFCVEPRDDTIRALIEEAKQEFKGPIEDVKIRIAMEV